MNTSMSNKSYLKFLIMIVLSFISMYIFMYSMVDVFANIYPSYNQFYMAAVMTAPMVLIEIFLMKAMYKNKKWNIFIIVGSTAALIIFFIMIRKQTAIDDTQFIKSMIPHHAGAILMCNENELNDPELKELCKKIAEGQKQEIDQMKSILQRLEK